MKTIRPIDAIKMNDEWLNCLMICYIEKEIFKGLTMKQS